MFLHLTLKQFRRGDAAGCTGSTLIAFQELQCSNDLFSHFTTSNSMIFLFQTHKSGSLQHHGHHHFSVKDEDPFDFVRPKKKYTRREPLCRPGRPAKRQHIVNKADIKQYDFHSSGEEDYPLVSTSENRVLMIISYRRSSCVMTYLGCVHFIVLVLSSPSVSTIRTGRGEWSRWNVCLQKESRMPLPCCESHCNHNCN